MFAGQHWLSIKPKLNVCWAALAQYQTYTECLLGCIGSVSNWHQVIAGQHWLSIRVTLSVCWSALGSSWQWRTVVIYHATTRKYNDHDMILILLKLTVSYVDFHFLESVSVQFLGMMLTFLSDPASAPSSTGHQLLSTHHWLNFNFESDCRFCSISISSTK